MNVAESKKRDVTDKMPPEMAVLVCGVSLMLGYLLFCSGWERFHRLPPIPVEACIASTNGEAENGKIRIQGKMRPVREGEIITLPLNRFLILLPRVDDVTTVTASRRACDILEVDGGRCVVHPKGVGRLVVEVRRRVLGDTLTVARTRLVLNVVEPDEAVSICYLRGFYEQGKMWISGAGVGLLNLDYPSVNVDVGELVYFAPANVDWNTGHCETNPEGYSLEAVVTDAGCKVVEGSAIIATCPGVYCVKLMVGVSKGCEKPAPIIVRVRCSNVQYQPGKQYPDQFYQPEQRGPTAPYKNTESGVGMVELVFRNDVVA